MTLEAKEKGDLMNLETNPIATVADPMAFNQKILAARLKQYHEADAIQKEQVFFDRGIPDVLAYMDYFKQPYGSSFSTIAEEHRYDTIFLLPIWKEIYARDSARFESYEEAQQIHDHLKNTYTELGYEVNEVAPDSIENRIEFILNQL